MKQVADDIFGYSYGAPDVGQSAVSVRDLDDLKRSAGFTEDDERYLRLAGEVLADQTKQIVEHWRGGIIAGIPNLARHSRTPEGDPKPKYLARSRFQQWILETCLRPYDQDWINYQQEIALRHTAAKKNKVDGDALRAVARGTDVRRGDEHDHEAVSGRERAPGGSGG